MSEFNWEGFSTSELADTAADGFAGDYVAFGEDYDCSDAVLLWSMAHSGLAMALSDAARAAVHHSLNAEHGCATSGIAMRDLLRNVLFRLGENFTDEGLPEREQWRQKVDELLALADWLD